jgi:hypothetical protein
VVLLIRMRRLVGVMRMLRGLIGVFITPLRNTQRGGGRKGMQTSWRSGEKRWMGGLRCGEESGLLHS